ncbi:MAG: H/ACA ribonucleoprotein complex subunit GAR1 [Nitrososphaeria archaeon]
MKKLGQVLHQARSGNLVVKADGFLKPSVPVYDRSGKKVGYVIETFGPISSPYVSVRPTTDRIRKLIGSELYTSKETG